MFKFNDDQYFKTNWRGLSKALSKPKVLYCYRNQNESCCLYRLYNKYASLMPRTYQAKCLYLRSKRRPMPNQWYIDSPLGINSIKPIINRMAETAGLPKGNYRNQSGRSSTCTRMFANKQDEQVICHVSGHKSTAVRTYKHVTDKSTAVRTYKHVTDDARRAASESIQGSIVKPQNEKNIETQCKVNGVAAADGVSGDVESDLNDFVPRNRLVWPKAKYMRSKLL